MDDSARQILEIGLLLLGAVAAGGVARRLGLPAIVGYLALGVAVSPFTPGYVVDRHQLALLADVGVVLPLFEVGIEVDLARLRRDHAALIWVVPIQTILTMALSAVVLSAAGLKPVAALLIGLSIAMSSSVVIVNMTRSRRRTTDRPTELALLGWSVVQDITGVVIAAVLLATLGAADRPVGLGLLGIVLFALLAIAVARLLPLLLRRVRDEHDLFLILSVATGLTIAGAGAALFGVPLALAAFVGGLAVTDSHDAAEARRRLLPFRDLFAVLFFVAIGTLIDPGSVGAGLGWLALIVGLIVVGKVGLAYGLARLSGIEARPAQLAIGLGQVGEFSFVLASAALAAGEIDATLFVAVILAVAVTIAGSTILVRNRRLGSREVAG